MRPALVETSGLEFKRLLDLLSRLEVRGGLLKDFLLPGSAKVDLHRAGGGAQFESRFMAELCALGNCGKATPLLTTPRPMEWCKKAAGA